MDSAPQGLLKIIKIQQNLGKKLLMKNLTYQNLLDKLKQGFQLRTNQQYHLYYLDEKKRKITINSPQDYQIFTQSQYEKILYICKTTKSILSMTNYKFIKQQTEEQMQAQNVLHSTSQKIKEKLDQFKHQLKNKVDKKLNENILNLESKYLSKDIYETIHKQTKCNNCKSKDYIKGTLYKCVICDLILCFRCQQLIQHQHPFFQIVKLSQKIPPKDKIEFSLQIEFNEIQERQYSVDTDLLDQFIQITQCDRHRGIELLRKHPQASISQLCQFYYNEQI